LFKSFFIGVLHVFLKFEISANETPYLDLLVAVFHDILLLS